MNFGLFSDGFHPSPATRLTRLYELRPGAEKRREMRLWKENQQRKGIWSKTGEAALMQHWLQNWAIIECQKSSAQCIRGWLTRQIARATANRKPIFRSRDHYSPIRCLVLQFKVLTSRLGAHSYIYCQRYGDVNVSEFSLNKLIMHLRVIQQQQLQSFIHPHHYISSLSLLSWVGQGWMHSENVMLKIFKSVRESVRVLCCLF